MAWNEPGGGRNQDPWRGRDGRGQPDLDDVIKKLQDRFGGMLGGGGGNDSGGFGLLALVLGVILAVWFVAGLYRVEQAEEALVLRFGKYHSTESAGLHWNPWGIDSIMKVDVNQRETMPVRATMLTEDQNIVDIDLQVQYVVTDSRNFFLESSSPIDTLRNSVESALRHVVGGSEMDRVLTDGREAIAVEVHQRLQDYLDRYKTGLMVDKLNIEDAHPPKDVKAAFDDVIKAKEDEERVKNEAEAYANQIVPEARGEAQRMIEEANAYKAEIVERAKGQANRFERLYVEYKMAPEVTRRRMYIDTMENVLSNTSKILVDVEGGNNLMYLPLDKLMQGRHDERSVVTEANTSQQSKTTTQKTSDTVRGLERIRQSRESRWENR
ncbi:MAG: FtsH protease activity modulator HflK [Pseudomonadales bacterium]|uniref:FtsH protease activity modulator HflK n=1 Tax=unclassified Ketobacter TaxID=2639109 RepID=UPI000C93EB8B|nr:MULTISPECIES: FtsH protease activity modulator HflK [unclassified Ketobacter]MAQ24070.1 FtsH protease activity modulator HflK [Pseudomonadales bacterium]MEC8813918.1 FtsH protease activity modulator HflK [Pseudomonadota bacterium]TNC88439.1 MAG: FtsH protease activity modulator HflK [Alcanivorax sp.]HAG97232.1 FtsH protease activity modulator HflK [Gammaproteobacteria bacterium]MCK5789640.1 FtsH protease activity modulator HflK [Ketobacter sp.]|tara:strand:- start:14347 stop:15492 length:1146 start_codon:yes stop_codon:yes gene_type:complete